MIWLWLVTLCALVLAGIIPGTFIFTNTDTRLLEGIFGVAVVLIALEMLNEAVARKIVLIMLVVSGLALTSNNLQAKKPGTLRFRVFCCAPRQILL